MKGRLLVVVWLMLVPIAWAAMTTKTWDISEAVKAKETYSSFLEFLRNEVKDPNEKAQGIPVMRKSTTSKKDDDNYLLVELKVSAEKSMILSIDRSNLYVMGYSDKFKDDKKIEQCRFHVFKDQQVLRCNTGDGKYKRCGLCDGPNAISQPINYKSSYPEIVKNIPGETPRTKTALGFKKLKDRVELVYGSNIAGKKHVQNEAEFLLTAIQMVAEATRFSYIQTVILTEDFFNPNVTVVCYENNWATVSTVIKARRTPITRENPIDVKCSTFESPAAMQNDIALLCSKCVDNTNTLPKAKAKAAAAAANAIDNARDQVIGRVPISLLGIGLGIYVTYRIVKNHLSSARSIVDQSYQMKQK